MKINLHCHSIYSDGTNNIYDLATEHKKQKFSACVITDHIYPFCLDKFYSLNYKTFHKQKEDIEAVVKRLKYPIIQGIELNLYYEEVLVFGSNLINGIIHYVEDFNENNDIKSQYFNLLDYLFQNKERGAFILCHPAVDRINDSNCKEFYEKLFKLVDGYEKRNRGYDMFKSREIPEQLLNKKQFFNSDAHFIEDIQNGNNIHKHKILTEDDLIKYIKNN